MNKNVVIGTLAVVIVLILGYFAFSNMGPTVTVNQNPDVASTDNPNSTNNNTNNPSQNQNPVNSPSSNPAAPVAETGSQVLPSNSTAVVSGKVTPNDASTTYWYEYGATSALGSHTSMQTIGSGYNAITSPGYITGLRANTQYYFRLNAQNRLGAVNGVTYSFTTNNTPPPAGSAPTVETNNATNIIRNSVTLNGKSNPHGYDTSYWFEFGETNALGNLTEYKSQGNGQSLSSVSTSLSNLKPLTKYYFRLDAQNQFGTVNGSVLSFTTAGPAGAGEPVVTTNAATNVATSSVTLNGRLDPRGADTTYWFEYSKDSLIGHVIGTATPDQSMNGSDSAIGVKADVSGLERNTKYFFRLLAKNQYGTVVGEAMSVRTK